MIKPRSGFTIVELLIVIAIIGILGTVGSFAWIFSTNHARVINIEKNARTIKDYLDVVEAKDNADNQITQIMDQINTAPAGSEIKLGGGDVISNTDFFTGTTMIRDIRIDYKSCTDIDEQNCKIDGEAYRGALMFYAINTENKCALDEALYIGNTTSISAITASLSNQAGPGRMPYFTENGRNFCVVSIRNPNLLDD